MAVAVLVPLLLTVRSIRVLEKFLCGWLAGTIYFAILLWPAIVPFGVFGNSHFSHIAQLIMIASLEGAFIGVAFAAAFFVTRRVGFPLMLTLPVAWVAQEWTRGVFPWGGFPWGFLGYAACRDLRLIQFSEFTGVYGVSALIVVVNVAIFQLLTEARSVRAAIRIAAPAVGLVLAALIFGTFRIHQLERGPSVGRLRIAMAQGNIPPYRKWDPSMLAPTFKAYSEASAWAASRGVDLIVWPETAAAFDVQRTGAYPWGMSEHQEYRKKLLALAASLHTPILTGAPAISAERGEVSMRNRAYLVSGRGGIDGYYDKIHLLQFGEYVPMHPILGHFIKKQVEAPFDFSPGDSETVFPVKDAKLSVLICYESIYPDQARRMVDGGADILVNITNDAWFGKTSIPHQLLAMASMRAVENHTPMVRVANSGISAVITPTGRIIGATQLFTRTTEIQTVQWKGIRTIYSRIGDVFARSCFALTIVGLLMALCAKAKTEKSDIRGF